ncbi:transmembrane protein 100-like isoform 1-T1 [Spinachia spinachia]
MAHLTSNAPMPDELHGKDGAWTTRAPTSTPTSVPASTPAEVPARHMETRWNRGSVALAPRVPHVNEVQLTAATGGAEASWRRCTAPFAVVVLIAGVVVTVVAYTLNSHGSTISVLGLVLLSAGLVLLGSSAVCWRVRLRRSKGDQRRESRAALMASQGYCSA